MKVLCPKDESHDVFVTVAHVVQDWKVTAEGEFLEDLGTIETTHGPNTGNTWTCHICGTDAIVTDKKL